MQRQSGIHDDICFVAKEVAVESSPVPDFFNSPRRSESTRPGGTFLPTHQLPTATSGGRNRSIQ
jgi:hypothetical protein